MYPAAYEGVRCVGACAYASAYATWTRRPDIIVPTHDIPVVDLPSSWKLVNGTSVATMIAAGVVERMHIHRTATNNAKELPRDLEFDAAEFASV